MDVVEYTRSNLPKGYLCDERIETKIFLSLTKKKNNSCKNIAITTTITKMKTRIIKAIKEAKGNSVPNYSATTFSIVCAIAFVEYLKLDGK